MVDYTLTNKEKDEFLNGSSKQAYKMQGHQWIPLKGVGKMYCKSCGLVSLRNKATQWCVDKGCNYEDHKAYEATMKRLTKNNI